MKIHPVSSFHELKRAPETLTVLGSLWWWLRTFISMFSLFGLRWKPFDFWYFYMRVCRDRLTERNSCWLLRLKHNPTCFHGWSPSCVVWREVTRSHSILWRTALVFSWTSVSHLDRNAPTALTGRNRRAADVTWLHGLMDSWRKAAVKMWGDEYNASLTQVTTEREREREDAVRSSGVNLLVNLWNDVTGF